MCTQPSVVVDQWCLPNLFVVANQFRLCVNCSNKNLSQTSLSRLNYLLLPGRLNIRQPRALYWDKLTDSPIFYSTIAIKVCHSPALIHPVFVNRMLSFARSVHFRGPSALFYFITGLVAYEYVTKLGGTVCETVTLLIHWHKHCIPLQFLGR